MLLLLTSTNRELHDAAIEADVEETTFSHRRKKIDEIGLKILLAIFQRDVMKDEAVAIESMEESIMEIVVDGKKFHYDLNLCLADTLRIQWERKSPDERELGLQAKSLRHAASICLKCIKIMPGRSDAYWSLGLILRCRGAPEPAEDDDDDGDNDKKKKKKKKKR